MIEDVIITPITVIKVDKGDVLHALKATDNRYSGFGEAYFSLIDRGAIKGWKRHREMTLNLVVPIGSIRFVLFDDRDSLLTTETYLEVILSRENYRCLTIPPMVWVGFQGLGDSQSILLNIANIPHDPNEVDKQILGEKDFDWRMD